MHTLESDKMSVFHVFIFVTCFKNSMFYWKTPEVKNFHWTICNLCYNFHINLFRHHREITIVKLRGIMHIAQHRIFWDIMFSWLCSLQSAVWSTLQSIWYILGLFTLRCDAHRGVWLCGMMHTAEFGSVLGCTPQSIYKNWNISVKSKKNSKILFSFLSGARMDLNNEKIEVKNLVTHSL